MLGGSSSASSSSSSLPERPLVALVALALPRLANAAAAASSASLQQEPLAVDSPRHESGPPLASSTFHASTLAAAAVPAHTMELTGRTLQGYVVDHAGFVSACLTLTMLPLFIFLGCCIARRCRRATKRATMKKRPDMDDDAEESPPRGRAAATPRHAPPESSSSRQPAPEPKLPPVRVDPTLLPVDAYLGVPPKQFVL